MHQEFIWGLRYAGRVNSCSNVPHVCRAELGQLQAGRDDAANFLLQCLADSRQEALAEQGHAALAAAASGRVSERQLLAGMPSVQREAVLRRLLQQLGINWQEREGLVLPASGFPSGCVTGRTAEGGGVQGSSRPSALHPMTAACLQTTATGQQQGAALPAASSCSS